MKQITAKMGHWVYIRALPAARAIRCNSSFQAAHRSSLSFRGFRFYP